MIEFKYEFKDLHGVITAEASHKCHEETIPEIVQSFRQFLLGIGFHPDTVDNYIEAD